MFVEFASLPRIPDNLARSSRGREIYVIRGGRAAGADQETLQRCHQKTRRRCVATTRLDRPSFEYTSRICAHRQPPFANGADCLFTVRRLLQRCLHTIDDCLLADCACVAHHRLAVAIRARQVVPPSRGASRIIIIIIILEMSN